MMQLTEPAPREEKRRILDIIEMQIGGRGTTWLVNRRRPDWHVGRNGTFSVFITYSKQDQLFYDIDPDDVCRWLKYSKAFVVFVVGHHKEALILPLQAVRQLIQEMEQKGYRPSNQGGFKLHLIHRDGMYRFLEIPTFNTSMYLNNYSLFD